MDRKPLPPQDLLRKYLRYEPYTGRLFWLPRDPSDWIGWKSWNTRFAGKEAFTSFNGQGYKHSNFLNSKWFAHRIIWKLVYGIEPNVIDHINGDRSDNRLCNLRDVTPLMNSENRRFKAKNITGVTGVKWRPKTRNFAVVVGGGPPRRIQVGTYNRFCEAIRIRKLAAEIANRRRRAEYKTELARSPV
jgi:hypothetical protein